MDWKLEVVSLPVADLDRAKAFYLDQVGFDLQVDHRAGEDFRVIQLTPPGSACAIALMANVEAAGTVNGLHLVVSDIEAAWSQLSERGAGPSGLFHFIEGTETAGAHPNRGDYESFLTFRDPDGNSWMVQEVRGASAAS